jgi:hypothetical protein
MFGEAILTGIIGWIAFFWLFPASKKVSAEMAGVSDTFIRLPNVRDNWNRSAVNTTNWFPEGIETMNTDFRKKIFSNAEYVKDYNAGYKSWLDNYLPDQLNHHIISTKNNHNTTISGQFLHKDSGTRSAYLIQEDGMRKGLVDHGAKDPKNHYNSHMIFNPRNRPKKNSHKG